MTIPRPMAAAPMSPMRCFRRMCFRCPPRPVILANPATRDLEAAGMAGATAIGTKAEILEMSPKALDRNHAAPDDPTLRRCRKVDRDRQALTRRVSRQVVTSRGASLPHAISPVAASLGVINPAAMVQAGIKPAAINRRAKGEIPGSILPRAWACRTNSCICSKVMKTTAITS